MHAAELREPDGAHVRVEALVAEQRREEERGVEALRVRVLHDVAEEGLGEHEVQEGRGGGEEVPGALAHRLETGSLGDARSVVYVFGGEASKGLGLPRSTAQQERRGARERGLRGAQDQRYHVSADLLAR